MKNRILPWVLALLALSCGNPVEQDPQENPAPALVSTNPSDGTAGIDAATLHVVFTFDQDIVCTSDGQRGISVDGGASISGVSASGAALTVTVTGLGRGKSYTLTLPAGTVRGYKQNQKGSAAITFRFSTKEADPAPVLVSTDPADGTVGIEGTSLSVAFTFDQDIRCPSEEQKGITVNGGASISQVAATGTTLTVDVVRLSPGRSYTVTLPAGTVLGYKQDQEGSAAITFHFSTKESESGPDDPSGWETAASAVRNMGVGWNLGNTLDANSGSIDNLWIEAYTGRKPADYETAWGQPVATRQLIHMFKEAGFNAIRVPVTWYPHMGLPLNVTGIHWDKSTWTGYDVDPVWMARVREVVGYVIDEGMYCILNVHHDTGTYTTSWLRADEQVYAAVRERYCSLWTQIATEFEPFGERLVFESFNEMLDVANTWNYASSTADAVINRINADFVATVRATGGNNANRNLILNTYAASPDPRALQDFQLPEDTVPDHLMAEVHSYAPYHFAFETSTPKTVFDDACDREVRSIIDGLGQYLVARGIPCILGEFGVDTQNRAESEMAKQAACYVSQAAKYDIPCFYWMGLSDGTDRSVPQWTKPVLKDAILQAYQENKND